MEAGERTTEPPWGSRLRQHRAPESATSRTQPVEVRTIPSRVSRHAETPCQVAGQLGDRVTHEVRRRILKRLRFEAAPCGPDGEHAGCPSRRGVVRAIACTDRVRARHAQPVQREVDGVRVRLAVLDVVEADDGTDVPAVVLDDLPAVLVRAGRDDCYGYSRPVQSCKQFGNPVVRLDLRNHRENGSPTTLPLKFEYTSRIDQRQIEVEDHHQKGRPAEESGCGATRPSSAL